jgi:hypothetical protein
MATTLTDRFTGTVTANEADRFSATLGQSTPDIDRFADYALLETGDYALLETGGIALLESSGTVTGNTTERFTGVLS